MLFRRLIKIKILIIFAVVIAVFCVGLIAKAAFNEKINYQGKLTNASGVAVADGYYCMKFAIYDALTDGSELWSEEWKTDNAHKVQITSGLFAILLGTQTSISTVDFNNASRYLEIQLDATCNDSYEEVFAPRKQLGAVPAAFEAKKLGGYTWASPGSIGATTPEAGAFTTLTASSTFTAPIQVSSATGVAMTATNGVLTVAGTGDGFDENLTFDFNATTNTVGINSGTSVATLNFNALALTTTGLGTLGTLLVTETSGTDLPIILRNTQSTGSDTGAVTIYAQTTSTPYQMGKIVFGRTYDYTAADQNSFMDFYTAYENTDTLAMRIDESQNFNFQANNLLTTGSITGGTLLATASGGLTLGTDAATNTAGYVKMFSAGANNYYTTFTAGTQTANATYTLPTAMPASNKFLQSTDAGVLSWETVTSGYTNLTSFVAQTAWRSFYSNTDGDVVELAFGAAGTALLSGGAAAAPAWTTATYPSTTVANQILYSTATNVVGATASLTFDDTNGLQISNGGDSQVLSGTGSLVFGGIGGVDNENLTLDFETTTNTVAIGTGTGVTGLDFSALNIVTTGTIGGGANIATTGDVAAATYHVGATAGIDGTTCNDITVVKGIVSAGTCTSDVRFKDINAPLENVLEKLENIRGVYYTLNETYRADKPWVTTNSEIGMIAQEVEAQFPELVNTNEDGYKSIKYSMFTSVLVEAIKELNQKVDILGGDSINLDKLGATGTGQISGVESTTISQSLIDLGMTLVDGVATLKEVVADKLTVKIARMEKMEMVDSNTGDVYCTWIASGEWQKVKGACSTLESKESKVETEQPTPQEPTPAPEQPTPQEPTPAPEQPTPQEPTPAPEQPTPQEPAPEDKTKKDKKEEIQTFAISSVAPVSDIAVANGTAIGQAGLPASVTVTLSDASTQDLQITWDNGNPTYDPATAGEYIFTGGLTLPEVVSNPNNFSATCKVTVQAPIVQEPEPEESSPIGEVVEEAASALLNGMWEFIKWLVQSSIAAISRIIPDNIKKLSANLSFSITQNVKSDFQQLSLQVKLASRLLIESVNKFSRIFIIQ